MNLGGAVEDPIDARVAVVAFDRQVLAESHAAEDLHRAIDHPPECFGGLHLGHRDPLAGVAALVDHPRRLQHQQSRGIDLDRTVGEHLLDHLELADRAAELLALVGVVDRQLQHVRRFADRAGANLGQAHPAEHFEREAKAAAFLA